MGCPNPLSVPDAIAFDAWAIDSSGCLLSLFWDCAIGRVRIYVAAESDAVHLIVTDTPDPLPEGVHHGWGLMGHHESFVELAEPLGDRAVVDATSGIARPRVASGEVFETWCADQQSIVKGKKRLRQQRRKRELSPTWQYDEPHALHPYVPTRTPWHESKFVSIADLTVDRPS